MITTDLPYDFLGLTLDLPYDPPSPESPHLPYPIVTSDLPYNFPLPKSGPHLAYPYNPLPPATSHSTYPGKIKKREKRKKTLQLPRAPTHLAYPAIQNARPSFPPSALPRAGAAGPLLPLLALWLAEAPLTPQPRTPPNSSLVLGRSPRFPLTPLNPLLDPLPQTPLFRAPPTLKSPESPLFKPPNPFVPLESLCPLWSLPLPRTPPLPATPPIPPPYIPTDHC